MRKRKNSEKLREIVIKFGIKGSRYLGDVELLIRDCKLRDGAKAYSSCEVVYEDFKNEIVKEVRDFKIVVSGEIFSGLFTENDIRNIIGHEVAHILLYKENKFSIGHGIAFIKKCKEIGLDKEFIDSGYRLQIQEKPRALSKYGYVKVICENCKKEIMKTNCNSTIISIGNKKACPKCNGHLKVVRY